MTSSNIEQYIPLNKKYLSHNYYTLSLLGQAEDLGLIDQQSMENIHKQFMVLLGESILKYTQGESSSVKVETGERIMLSILYCMDACTRSFSNPKDAINLLISSTIKETYEAGLEMVESCLRDTQLLYQEIKNNKLNVPNEAYQDTINQALPQFFKDYDVLFCAQDTMASIDYPLLFDNMQIQGIYYIRQYLATLVQENQFCRFFDGEDTKKLLDQYGQVYGIDYKEALINIFEIVLTNAIFSVLSGNRAGEILITKAKYAYLQQKFKGLNPAQCTSRVSQAVEILIAQLGIDNPGLRDYIRNFKGVLMPRFLCALEHDTLSNVIILEGEGIYQADIIFDKGYRLDNDSFCELVGKIMECAEAAEKAEIIGNSIKSLGDFIDVLEADCLFGDDYQAIFAALGDLELSILAKMVFIEELRSDPSQFSLLSAEQTADIQWQIEYHRFVHSLSPIRLESIEKYLHSSFQVGNF